MADRFDLDAIDADDALLDLLAAGGESARTAGEHDPAVKLLADLRLAVEVEDELPVETIDDPESFLARCAALNPVTDPFARKVAARGLALGVAAVAALSVSGVAAAVTGDPLSPYEKVIEKMVDAVRPETSFPKEQLDGMPVVDKTKIVKVAKDFKKKADERKAEEQQKAKTNPFVLEPPADRQQAMPPLLRPAPVEKPTVTQESIAPEPTQPTKAPEKTDDQSVDDTTTEPTAPPTDGPTTEPSTDPTTPPPTEPTTDPTTPPPTTEPSTDPTTPPPNNGESGETGTNPTTTPTVPGDTSGSDQGSNTGESSDDSPAEDQLPIQTKPPVDDTPPPAEDQKTPPADEKPAESPLGGLTGLVEKILPQVLPTPSGEAAEVPSAATAFGTEAKHSSGKVTTGSVKQTYAKGKHSTGLYAEGKHAAIARAHGSTESPDVLTILGVVNKPTS